MKINFTIKGMELNIKYTETEMNGNVYTKFDEINIEQDLAIEEFNDYLEGIAKYVKEVIGGI